VYVVVEQVCESCGAENEHLTAQCPQGRRTWAGSFVSSIFGWMDTLLWLAGRLA